MDRVVNGAFPVEVASSSDLKEVTGEPPCRALRNGSQERGQRIGWNRGR